MKFELIHGDVIEYLKSLARPGFHAALFDPPYHLTSITNRFGKPDSAPAQGDFQRVSKGFMGQTWDGGKLVFQPETWETLSGALYPGAFTMAYCAARGWHRQAVAMEDGGFIFHPSIFLFGMVYGSGWPKATRLDNRLPEDEAATWAGHRYGLGAIGPALEPILVGQKPYQGRPIDCIVENGAGALNIEAGLIGKGNHVPAKGPGWGKSKGVHEGWRRPSHEHYEPRPAHDNGRFPKNLILQHHPDCTSEVCVSGCAVRVVGEQSGERKGGSPRTGFEPSSMAKNVYGQTGKVSHSGYDDSGTAADLFFYNADWNYEVYERLMLAAKVQYISKPGQLERDAGLDESPDQVRQRVNPGGLEREPRFAPTVSKNNHPTLKSIKLNKYLAGLLLPPAKYAPRRILVPFCGSGSEVFGCLLAGWDEVVGIEKEESFFKIAQGRVSFWAEQIAAGVTDVDTILAGWQNRTKSRNNGQLSLF